MNDEQILAVVDKCFDHGHYDFDNSDWIAFARAILAARDGQSVEPVAWMTTRKTVCMPITQDKEAAKLWEQFGYDVTPLAALNAPLQSAENRGASGEGVS